MKSTRIILALIVVFAFTGGITAAAPEPKTDVCHKPIATGGVFHDISSGEILPVYAGNTLNVNGNALEAHLGHGDVHGPCSGPAELEGERVYLVEQ